MKILSLIMWVTQFGLSILMPPCLLLLLAVWLQARFGLGMWIIVLMGILGLLISYTTAKANLRSMRKDAQTASDSGTPPVAFNEHL